MMKSKKEERQSRQLEKFGIDFENYDFDELRRRNADSARELAASLAGSQLYSVGSLLTGNASETFMIEMTRALVEQNFILIRQNEELARCLKLIYGRLVR